MKSTKESRQEEANQDFKESYSGSTTSYCETITPMPGYVAVKVLGKEEITYGGKNGKVIVPITVRDNEGSVRAEVIAYGGPKFHYEFVSDSAADHRVFDQPDLAELGLVPGCIVAINRMHGLFVEANGEDHKLVKQEDIACVLS